MEVVTKISDVRRLVARARNAGKTIGLVPTMGALHAGHGSLVEQARDASDCVVVSIFVNPIQFGPSEDYGKYPRTPKADEDICRAAGASLIFMPTVEEMYPDQDVLTRVSVLDLDKHLCGQTRPGHFTGVCTVVAKLFNIVQPDAAFFGAKDFQQTVVIRRMVADLDIPIRIVICPTVREKDGLAMSSRNAYLSPEERAQAPAIHESLQLAAQAIRQGRPGAGEVVQLIQSHLSRRAPAGAINYIKIVDPSRLTDVLETNTSVLIAVAVKFGKARLIDNVLVSGS